MPTQAAPSFPIGHSLIAVLWPSFLVAIVAEGIFFSIFNPANLVPFDSEVGLGFLGFYTIGFFAFWLCAAISSLGTLYLIRLNVQPRPPSHTRPE